MPTQEINRDRPLDCDMMRVSTIGKMSPPLLTGRPVRCAQCGKRFMHGDEWAYTITTKRGGQYKRRRFCSWGCIQAWRTAHEDAAAAQKARKKIDRELAGETNEGGQDP